MKKASSSTISCSSKAAAFREEQFRALLAGAQYPARSPDMNIADIKAQVAANEKGVQELQKVVAHYGLGGRRAYMRHVMDNAEESVRRVIERLSDGSLRLRDGRWRAVAGRGTRRPRARAATIDFTGTGAQHAGNFNAPPAVTRAVVLYVFRCLVGEDIPLNDGCLKPLSISSRRARFCRPRPAAPWSPATRR